MATIEVTTPAARRTQPHATPTYYESLSIADCLAKSFTAVYPSKEESPKLRDYLRAWVVPGLRWLWRNGNAEARTTLAARVAVWRCRTTEDIRALQNRVRARELSRVEGGAL